MDRLRSSSRREPGFRRARHFTYAAGCPRANISGANVTLLDTLVDILVADFGRGVRFVVAGVPHSTRLRYARIPTPALRHLIEKPHTK